MELCPTVAELLTASERMIPLKTLITVVYVAFLPPWRVLCFCLVVTQDREQNLKMSLCPCESVNELKSSGRGWWFQDLWFFYDATWFNMQNLKQDWLALVSWCLQCSPFFCVIVSLFLACSFMLPLHPSCLFVPLLSFKKSFAFIWRIYRQIFHPLIQCPDDCNSQSWGMPKLGAQGFIWVSFVGGSGINSWTIFWCFFLTISRDLCWDRCSWDKTRAYLGCQLCR